MNARKNEFCFYMLQFGTMPPLTWKDGRQRNLLKQNPGAYLSKNSCTLSCFVKCREEKAREMFAHPTTIFLGAQ